MRNNKLKLKRAFTPTPVFAKKKLVWGFTLIETLVAITILSAAVAGPMILSIKSISSASVSQDQLVAFYLGQEVIEYARNVRDTNLISGNNWLNGLDVCKSADGSASCYIDVIKNPITVTVCGTNCPRLDFDGANYTYKSDGTDGNTVFTRTVKIENPVGTNYDEAKISVFVEWTGKYGGKTMNLQDNIFNWK